MTMIRLDDLRGSVPSWLRAFGGRHCTVSMLAVALLCVSATSASAQALSERGYVETRGQFFFQEAPNDPEQTVGDVLLRQDVFFKAADWLRLGAGLDLRANSHDQVEDEWRLDFADRGILRPRAAVRRLTATITSGHLTLDVGKQFIRWGRADILNPTDRLAPRDYLNVIDTEFLPVLGARAVIQSGSENFEVVFVPRLTPSRLPLIDQRWTVLPPEAAGITLVDLGNEFPEKTQQGVRWNHVGGRVEGSLSFFDGLQNLPNIRVDAIDQTTAGLTRLYPKVRSYGGDIAIPTSVATLKGEAAILQSPDEQNNDYVLYVIEFERQVGEWVFDGGYAGEVLVTDRGAFRFAPDSGVAKSIIGRVGYTLGPRRSLAIEGAARQSGDGFYVKGEFSQAFGQHWRATFTGVGLAGEDSDFLGQYHRNSHASIALRFSY
jgi:hypothetical protein